MIARRHVVLLGPLLLLTVGCGSRQYWEAQPVSAQGIVIQPAGVYARGPLLTVRTVFINQTGAPIVVDRDAVVLALADGRIVARSEGRTTQHTPYVIPPNGSHNVWVDFHSDGFDWSSVPSAAVNWANGVTIGGAPIALPPLLVHQ